MSEGALLVPAYSRHSWKLMRHACDQEQPVLCMDRSFVQASDSCSALRHTGEVQCRTWEHPPPLQLDTAMT